MVMLCSNGDVLTEVFNCTTQKKKELRRHVRLFGRGSIETVFGMQVGGVVSFVSPTKAQPSEKLSHPKIKHQKISFRPRKTEQDNSICRISFDNISLYLSAFALSR